MACILQSWASGVSPVVGRGGPDAVGGAVLPPEQSDCDKKELLLSVPAAQVLICSDVHVFGLASKLCDL